MQSLPQVLFSRREIVFDTQAGEGQCLRRIQCTRHAGQANTDMRLLSADCRSLLSKVPLFLISRLANKVFVVAANALLPTGETMRIPCSIVLLVRHLLPACYRQQSGQFYLPTGKVR